MTIDPRLRHIVAEQPYPLLFATISGAHLRGAHILPLDKVVGLEACDETVEDSRVIEGLEMDIVSHDMLRPVAQEERLRAGTAFLAAHRPHHAGAR